VHTTIFPDATGFACADGQKDVCAFFNRAQADARTTALMAFRTDWIGRDKSGSMDANWLAGGTLRLERLLPAGDTGRYDYQGSKGNKIEWEMAPMAEHLVYTAQLPGPAARTLAGLDAVVHHPGHRFSVLINRMTAAGIVVDRQSWEPICCLHSPEGAPNNLPIRKMASDPDIWEIEFEDVKCVAHEAGFSPDGRFYVSMNNIRQNNMAIYDSSAADPREWRVVAVVRDPAWVGEFPSPFHLCFSMDGSKMFVSVLYPKPRDSACYVVDTKSWQIVCKFENIGPDCQTMAVTYDGKYVVQVFSGFQRLSSGLFIFTQDTLEPVGYLPNPGGPHDCVLVPPAVEHLRNSRCTTL
jgi:hypothetical protein